MKKILPLLFTLFLSSTFFISCAQKKEKKEIKKEIRVEQENGNTTVTISETEDGKVTKKIMTGEDAEKYLEEQNESNSFYFSGDDEDGNQVVIVKEMEEDGESGHHVWVSDDDDAQVKMIMTDNGLEDEIEKLLEEFDALEKEDIKVKLKEMMRDFEKMEKEMIVKMDGDVMSGNNIYIIKKVGDDEDEDVVFVQKNESGHNNNLNMNVYPNPSKGSFTIDLDLQSEKEAKVNVVDSNGNEVYNKMVKGAKSHKLEVKLKNSKKGMFIVTVKQGDTVMKSKIMID